MKTCRMCVYVYYTFVVVFVGSVKTRITCVCLYVCYTLILVPGNLRSLLLKPEECVRVYVYYTFIAVSVVSKETRIICTSKHVY